MDYIIALYRLRTSGMHTDLAECGLTGFRPFEVETDLAVDADCTICFGEKLELEQFASFCSVYDFQFEENYADCHFGRYDGGHLFYMQRGDNRMLFVKADGESVVRCNMGAGAKVDTTMLRFGLWMMFGLVITPLGGIAIHSSVIVKDGGAVLCLGESGTGKSTLLSVMGLLLEKDGGSYTFDGKDTAGLSDDEKTDIRAKKIGFLFQDTNLIQALTLRENLLFAQTLGGSRAADEKKADAMLDKLGLIDRAGFLPYQLSGGQRRRAMAARCLIHSPELILADEPTNDLDDEWAAKVVELLAEAAQKGAGVVMVTHNSRWTAAAALKYKMQNRELIKI